METVTARDANRHFARILKEVEAGREYIVTPNGTPVARIVPERTAHGERRLTPAKEQALAESMEWLRRGWPLGLRRVDRDELHDEASGTDRP